MANRTLQENVNQAISDFDSIQQAIIDKGVEVPNGTPTSEYSTKIGDIQGGGGGIDTSEVTDFSNFCANNRFTDEQLKNINTASGTNFSNMFSGCNSLKSIPPLDTSNGTNFSYMFDGCNSLKSIPQLDTSNGTSFEAMFGQCNSLTEIPPLNTSKGTNFKSMFYQSSLTEIPPLDTSNGTNFSNMFRGCNITSIPQLDTSNGTSFSTMFYQCNLLKSIPPLDTSKGTGFSQMFYGCALDTIEITSFVSSNDMFRNCYSLENLTVTGTITVNNNYFSLANSSKLTVDSLMSVINALEDNTGKTTYKITLGSTNLAKLTDEQKQIAIDKNYTLA